MAKKKQTKTTARQPVETQTIYRTLGWALLAGVWLLAAASLISYDPADPPGHTVAPLNETPTNWVGQVGATIAYRTYRMAGPGVWVMMTGWLTLLILAASGKPARGIARRCAGLALMSIAASTVLGMGMPQTFDRPEGAGGLLAAFLLDGLLPMLAVTGTMLIMTLLFLVGSIMAADQAVLAASHHLGRLCLNLANVRVPKPVLAGALAGVKQLPDLLRRDKAEAEAESDNPTVPNPKRKKKRGWKKDEDDAIDEDAGGLGGTESFDPDANRRRKGDDEDDAGSAEVEDELGEDEEWEWVYEDDEEGAEAEAASDDEDEEETDDETASAAAADDDEEEDAPGSPDDDAPGSPDAPGAYLEDQRKFDPDELRQKIKQLPINFAPKGKASSAPPREPDLSGYQFPGMDHLAEPESNFTEEQERIVREQAVHLEEALRQYRIDGEVVGIDSGPVITLFDVRLAPGTKVSRLNAISMDLARSLKAHNIRIVPNTAGKDTVGIEVPNIKKERVRLKELMSAEGDKVKKMRLPMFLGKDASGNPLIQDLAAMPHMLIAGTTGSGKSVCMNSIIMSFLYTKRPDELKLVLVDPKMVEMSMFKDIPHLMCPVVTEMSKAAAILEWAVGKMDERYELLAEAGVRDIGGYNALSRDELMERFQPTSEAEEAKIPKKLPYMVFIIDELADLMMTNKEVEDFIVRIAQKARAVGIHLILATQRPQANVVTGLIKGNMPCRIGFKVASGLDSRIVLDQKGAELLLGHGDMLFLSPRSSKLSRAQGTLVDDPEIRGVVKFLKDIAQQHFEPQLVQLKGGNTDVDEEAAKDPLFEDAVRVVLESKRGSVSLLQRRLTIGYSRASRLVEAMANAGILGDYKGSQAREVNITIDEWEALRAQAEADAAVEVNGNVEGDDEDGGTAGRSGAGGGRAVAERGFAERAFDDDADIEAARRAGADDDDDESWDMDDSLDDDEAADDDDGDNGDDDGGGASAMTENEDEEDEDDDSVASSTIADTDSDAEPAGAAKPETAKTTNRAAASSAAADDDDSLFDASAVDDADQDDDDVIVEYVDPDDTDSAELADDEEWEYEYEYEYEDEDDAADDDDAAKRS